MGKPSDLYAAQVLLCIKQSKKPVTTREISVQTGVDQNAVRNAVTLLRDAELIRLRESNAAKAERRRATATR